MNQHIKQNKGLTLIEIIIAMAILGLLAMAFFTLFGFNLMIVNQSGKNSVSSFQTQSILESRISGDTTPSSQLTESDGTITLYKSGAPIGTVDGKILVVTYPYNHKTDKTVVAFISE